MNSVFAPGIADSKKITTDDVIFRLSADRAVSMAGSFSELLDDFVLFHIGLFVTHSGMRYDPVQMYMAHAENEPIVCRMVTNTPIFSGFQGSDNEVWRTMWACAKRDWPGLMRFIESLSVIDQARGVSASTGWNKIKVSDVLFVESGRHIASSSIPLIPVFSTNIVGNPHTTVVNIRFSTNPIVADSPSYPSLIYPELVLSRHYDGSAKDTLLKLNKLDVDEMWKPIGWTPPEVPVAPPPETPLSDQEFSDAWRREFGSPDSNGN